MPELDASDRILFLDEAHQPPERFDESIIPDSKVAHRPAAAPFDLGRLDHNQPRAAGRKLPCVHQVPICRKPLHGRILMHWWDHDPIAQPYVPYRQGCEQHRSGHGISSLGSDDIGQGVCRKAGKSRHR